MKGSGPSSIFYSVQTKIFLGIALILFFGLAISTYMSLRIQERQFMTRSRAKIMTAVESVGRLVELEMEKEKPAHVALMMDMIKIYPHETTFRIYDMAGRVVQSSDTSHTATLDTALIAELKDTEETRVTVESAGSDPAITGYRALPNKPGCQSCHDPRKELTGIVEIRIPISSVKGYLEYSRKMTILNAIFTFALMMAALSIFFTVLIGRPLANLNETMKEVSRGNLTARARVKFKDEIGQLAQNFNKVIERLHSLLKKEKEQHMTEIQHAERLATLGELASGIAHEVRNPISGISGAVQIIQNSFEDGDYRKDVMQEIQNEIERLDKFLQSFLDFARPAKPQFQFIDIHTIIDRSLSLCLQGNRYTHITVKKDYGKNLPYLFVDAIQMQQVFMNIIVNAFQAMNGEGELRVKTRKADGSVHTHEQIEILFTDTGAGIPPDKLERIFKPFFSSKRQGTGLGLTIAHRIVEQHHGKIEVDSEEGKGTTFRIILPLIEFEGRKK